MSNRLHAKFDGPHGEHLIELSQNSVTIIFDGIGYTWTKYGPTVETSRERQVLRALLNAAIEHLDTP
jgi:hypothetical protein